jgi:N-acetyl-anhydromuramyl-L-alanine amidase AmpD
MRSILFFAAAAFAAGCTVPLPAGELSREADLGDQGPTHAYDQAARVSGVPVELLLAISHVETGMQMVQGAQEFEGQVTSHGLMGIRADQLERAAAITGVSVEEVMEVRDENVLAAAMLLAEFADEEGIDTDDLAAWAPVVARYSGIDNEEAAAEYVHYEVYEVLQQGLELEGWSMPPQSVLPDFREPIHQRHLRLDDQSAIWTPSPNVNSRSGRTPEYVLIHTCEGVYSGCWGWLTNPASKVSAHYVVNDNGSEVRQLVDEDDRAWHAGANYDCDLNAGADCHNDGTSMNTLSVGIEHAGYASQSSFDPGMIQRSAELTCGITQRHGIPRDSYHIFGHGQIQPWSRTDPGPNWPWADYLERIQTECGDIASAPVVPQVEIDETLDASTSAEDDFAILVPAGASELRVTLSGTNGDADLYVNEGTAVSRSLYDCRSISNTSNEECVISNPAEGTYSIMVHAYKGYSSVRLTAAVDAASGTTPAPTTPPSTGGGSTWGDSGLPSQFVIDSNNGANQSGDWWVSVSSSWNASANVAGYYNTGYWWIRTASRTDMAEFTFVTDDTACLKAEAWWSAASDRGDATFIAFDEDDNELGRATVDQRSNGGRWVALGDWVFPAGTNRVALSSWGDGDHVVIADAVRMTDSTSCN